MTEKHRLICRIVDREDRPADWTTLENVAKRDPDAWRDVLFALRDDAEVRHAVDAQLAVAENVILPTTSHAGGNGWSTAAVLAAAGWLAALVMALLWLGSTLLVGDAPEVTESGEMAELIKVQTPAAEPTADNTGHNIVGELPRLMVQARPIAGREEVEVIYVRRTVERVLVKNAYKLKVDESGQPFTVPTDLSAYMPPRSY